jgi:hypothetical protein
MYHLRRYDPQINDFCFRGTIVMYKLPRLLIAKVVRVEDSEWSFAFPNLSIVLARKGSEEV